MKWCCIAGDCNKDILLSSTGPIFKIFTEQGFTQHMRMPTRDSVILIDHIYAHKIEGEIQSYAHDCYYSDHDIVFCGIQIV